MKQTKLERKKKTKPEWKCDYCASLHLRIDVSSFPQLVTQSVVQLRSLGHTKEEFEVAQGPTKRDETDTNTTERNRS